MIVLADYDAPGIADVLGLATAQPPASMQKLGFDQGRLRRAERPSPSEGTTFAASSFSALAIEQAVARGLPRSVLRHLAERIAGSDAAKVSTLEWSIVPKTTLERRGERLSPVESERTERLARLFVHAWRALGSEAEAREFMLAPHPELEGRTPLDASRTDLAARRAERILSALEYGLPV